MMKNTTLTVQQSARLAHIQAWAMSLLCGLLFIFAAAASTRIPYYVVEMDIPRLLSTVLFDLLVLVGLVTNICVHFNLRKA